MQIDWEKKQRGHSSEKKRSKKRNNQNSEAKQRQEIIWLYTVTTVTKNHAEMCHALKVPGQQTCTSGDWDSEDREQHYREEN